MTDQELEKLAVGFLDLWKEFKNSPEVRISFQRLPKVKKFIDMGLIASHVNPREGEYAIQHTHSGVAFFTGSGELVFTKNGLPFARKICDIYRKQDSHMYVVQIEYCPA